MIEQERQEMRAKLIELGFWGAGEPGEPATTRQDAQRLQERLVQGLADGTTLASTGYSSNSPARRVEVVRGAFIYQIATGGNYPESICLSALALPEFLRQHPECAGDQK
jgi:hypothetical protein